MAWAAMRKRSTMKQQTMLELNISSLIWENCKKKCGILRNLCMDTIGDLYSFTVQMVAYTDSFFSLPATLCSYLILNVWILEHQGQRSDVLNVHALTAPNLYCMFDALVNLSRGRLPYAGQRAVSEGGQDLQQKNIADSSEQ